MLLKSDASLYRTLLAAGLLLWAAYGCAVEVYRTWWLVRNDPWSEAHPATWRFGSAAAGRMETFARRIQPRLPAGAKIAVSTQPDPPQEALFRCLWIAYFLPRQEVLLARQEEDVFASDFWVTFERPAEDPRLELLEALPEGYLLAVR